MHRDRQGADIKTIAVLLENKNNTQKRKVYNVILGFAATKYVPSKFEAATKKKGAAVVVSVPAAVII